jgi:uncharacterized UPF0160 family protein
MNLSIVTHSGSFHADEALAVFMLRQLPKYKNHILVRTRDPLKIAAADIVVDVGGEYSPQTNRYDHHQRSFNEVYDKNHNIKLSSAGLVYKHFGKEVIQNILGSSPPSLLEIQSRVYDKLILSFDAIDNGVENFPSDVKPKYENPTDIAHQVARLNPPWNVKFQDSDADKLFLDAVQLTGKELVYWVIHRKFNYRLNIMQASGYLQEKSCRNH